ncbi:hypothetical protein Anas_01658 [Armadillidium nasatum]|uniref:Uncharacterized protein n=1 Tax=Armadillidium nasatum TaxID=96803 RepID=A0A5N5TGP2_9CRUS|nr:hypothetical protein Anas_01658 [Armadillidium nasatum]
MTVLNMPVTNPNARLKSLLHFEKLLRHQFIPLESEVSEISSSEDSSGCPNRCEKKDHFGQCRKSIPCLLQSKDAFSIIVGGGCPRCKRADPGGRCRVVLSCVMGLS